MATIFHPFYPAVSDSHTGYSDHVSTSSSSSYLVCGSNLLSEELTPLESVDISRFLSDVDSYPPPPPPSSMELSSFAEDIFASASPDFLWDEDIVTPLQDTAFQYAPNECLAFGQSVESPLTSSSPVSPTSLDVSSPPLLPSVADYSSLSPSSVAGFPSPTSISPVNSPSLSSPSSSPSSSRKRQHSTTTGSQAKKTNRGARKERKKEQNKTAAIRYRQKKREEADALFKLEQQLEEKNQQLHRQVDGMMTEIAYLKKLLQDVSIRKQQQMSHK